MRTAKFKIESYGDLYFEGFTNDEDWNGWACPYFSLEEAKKIVSAHVQAGHNAGYQEDSDVFYFDVQDEEEFFQAMQVEGLKLYPIGTSSWIWEEIVN